MYTEMLIISEFVSAVLASVIVYFFSKAHGMINSIYLLRLPIGFSFLASSYFFLGISLLYENDLAVSEAFLWLRLITQSFGFAFIAFSYYFSSKTERRAKYSLLIISVASAMSTVLFFGALMFSPPLMQIPSVEVCDEFFKIANLVFLGYIILHLITQFEPPHEKTPGVIYAPLGFSFLWLGQYSLLIWGFDGSQTAYLPAHVARLVSLILFISIYYGSRRTPK